MTSNRHDFFHTLNVPAWIKKEILEFVNTSKIVFARGKKKNSHNLIFSCVIMEKAVHYLRRHILGLCGEVDYVTVTC